ncbi:MAG: DUF350 domain-containing protein [Planctomycetes bacterium]|nr:DUF350 domain-containing protein [Planctomycetota bacterium]
MLALSIDWSRLANELLTAVIFSVMGIALLVLSFLVLDKLTPGSLWKELLEEHNTALGILLGAFGIGISLIIAAALI